MSREPDAPRARVLALVNQKGGVGKTTTAVNLGTALAAIGKHVLLVDLDPQGNASTGMGVDPSNREPSTYDVLCGDRTMLEIVQPTGVPLFSIAPSAPDLSGADLELAEGERRAHRLRDALFEPSADCAAKKFDIVLIDCPPSLNLLTVNAMVAANAALVPLQCEFFALEGLSQLLRTIEKVKARLNPTLTIQGVILTMFDKRNNLSSQVEDDVRKALGDLVYETVVPRNVRLSEAPSYGIPALIYDHACAGSRAYQSLAAELLRRERSPALRGDT